MPSSRGGGARFEYAPGPRHPGLGAYLGQFAAHAVPPAARLVASSVAQVNLPPWGPG
jgi:hypothetical protein